MGLAPMPRQASWIALGAVAFAALALIAGVLNLIEYLVSS
nr:MAG TPA: hypothetical protein [Caudoviricetes sp.]